MMLPFYRAMSDAVVAASAIIRCCCAAPLPLMLMFSLFAAMPPTP